MRTHAYISLYIHTYYTGDGVNYRVLSECDQYSLTREQLQQKKNKKKLKKQQRVLIRDTFSPTQGTLFHVMCNV